MCSVSQVVEKQITMALCLFISAAAYYVCDGLAACQVERPTFLIVARSHRISIGAKNQGTGVPYGRQTVPDRLEV